MDNNSGLLDPLAGRASCGVGLAVNIGGAKDHATVVCGLRILISLAHRGAENADGRTGDGAGLTVQIPDAFFRRCVPNLPPVGHYGAGNIFLPHDSVRAAAFLATFREECSREGLRILAERAVPVDSTIPGPLAVAAEPLVWQIFLAGSEDPAVLERQLYTARKRAEHRIVEPDFYVCSLSAQTIVYKGMLTPDQLGEYYLDLQDPAFASAVALVHSRFSTNTAPQWKLAQPFRLLCHNGEINTIRGNRAWMAARESTFQTPLFPDLQALCPLLQPGLSDSASLDNAVEFLTLAGMSLPAALTALIPESWNEKNPIPDSLKAYYEYCSILMEPWDGPAAVLFTDGHLVGGMLDRNGLRPMRYTFTKDGRLLMASEAGVVPIPADEVAAAGRLAPGKMLLVDLDAGRIVDDAALKGVLASAYPYRDWLERNRLDLADVSSGRTVNRGVPDAERRLAAAGYTKEDVERIIMPMAVNGKEPVGSAACDLPLPPLADRHPLFADYFRQTFAQVTNPPIDPIREELVMSITGYIGPVAHSLLDPAPANCRVVKVRHPVLTDRELDLLCHLKYRGYAAAVLPFTFPVAEGPAGLAKALERLTAAAEAAVDGGAAYLVLSDRTADAEHAAIPALLGLSAVHQHLLACRKRLQTGLVVETAEAREVEHVALLFAYGANAVNSYLAIALLDWLCAAGQLKTGIEMAETNYLHALEQGLLKIMSKMGIATIRSYRGAELFEAVGLSSDLCERYMGGTVSPLGGIGLNEIAEDVLARHREAWDASAADPLATDPGIYFSRPGGERHAWSPAVVRLLHTAADTGEAEAYAAYAAQADTGMFHIRDLWDTHGGAPIPLAEVESAEMILRRFVIEGISFGAIGREAHETLAAAANALGMTSNTGEGGEDRDRALPQPDGRDLRSRVRQVASARFGVSTRYLGDADELQIKVAQGAKPGEGGQLLGPKVDAVIAAVRHTLPGIMLISPPPHHDLYSIEDLKQLIYDLRCVNPRARISVKLVSETGVGTIAAGVAKAGADAILIAGADGGTGASPLSSLRYAGAPWELGLAEAQQALAASGLRGRVALQVDGGLRTGRDVLAAALLGAEEYGFATAALVALGCIMCRRCQTNECPAGIATQDPDRRARFRGTSVQLAHYFLGVAEDVRHRLAALGLRSLAEAVGRADLLVRRETAGRAALLDPSPLAIEVAGERCRCTGQPPCGGGDLDRRILADLTTGGPRPVYSIANTDRSVGAWLAGELIRRGTRLPDGGLRTDFVGTAGQSFGAFLVPGVTFTLCGEANDFVGKGLAGGRLVIRRPAPVPTCNVVAGNTALYGATGGEAYICGQVGERFAVRNSGAIAVVEGAGDHCCEYMTGGRVVVLGPCGRNFAAGMTAGAAYVLDEVGDFDRHCNMDLVELDLVEESADRAELRKLLEMHLRYTGSPKAAALLADWDASVRRFLKVMPICYKRLLGECSD